MMKRTSELKRTPFKPAEPKPAKGPKPKKCANRECRKPYMPDPRQPFVTFCSPDCGAVIALDRIAKQKAKQQRQERAQDNVKREAMKTRQDWAKEAQAAVNAYVRERDRDLPCISCGRHHQGQYHAGHYLARGSHPHMALVEANLAKQCAPCNTHLSGNQRLFRVGLIARNGLEAVEALECDNTPRKYTIDDLREIRDAYRSRVREMKKSIKGE